MKRFVKLFFTLILIGSMAVTSIAIIKPALAEETSETPETPEVPETPETPEDTPQTPTTPAEGNEWDGIINDPTPKAEPTTNPTPTPTVITNVVTTVNPPKTTSTPTEVTPTTTETPAKDSEPETPEPESEPLEDTNTPEVPSTFAPITTNTTNVNSDTARKITLLALISTAIVYFLGIEIWGLTKLTKTIKNEKLLKSAHKKAAKVKETKLSRSTN